MYKRKLVKYTNKHVSNNGLSLSREADMVMDKVLSSSGFFRGTGLNNGVGTMNPSMERFIGKWNNMNTKRSTKPLVNSNKIHTFKGI